MTSGTDPLGRPEAEAELTRTYELRFSPIEAYRERVWQVLVREFFQDYVRPTDTILDLGCGWGEFVNSVRAARKYAMDLNPDGGRHLASGTTFINQDCSKEWPLADDSLDLVFTSNFFEHLPSKEALAQTVAEARRCLRPGGRLLCLGPNVRMLPGAYWDFWDHHIALSERSLAELLRLKSFQVDLCLPRFLPYTMSGAFQPPLIFLRVYLKFPFLWRWFGRQFLVSGLKA